MRFYWHQYLEPGTNKYCALTHTVEHKHVFLVSYIKLSSRMYNYIFVANQFTLNHFCLNTYTKAPIKQYTYKDEFSTSSKFVFR